MQPASRNTWPCVKYRRCSIYMRQLWLFFSTHGGVSLAAYSCFQSLCEQYIYWLARPINPNVNVTLTRRNVSVQPHCYPLHHSADLLWSDLHLSALFKDTISVMVDVKRSFALFPGQLFFLQWSVCATECITLFESYDHTIHCKNSNCLRQNRHCLYYQLKWKCLSQSPPLLPLH